jgi:hypothetical protein
MALANWITYLSLEMNPDSAPPAKIVESLTKLGWKPVWGDWDFAWDWGAKWQPNGNNASYWQAIERSHEALAALKVDWSFRTFERGKETGWVYWH